MLFLRRTQGIDWVLFYYTELINTLYIMIIVTFLEILLIVLALWCSWVIIRSTIFRWLYWWKKGEVRDSDTIVWVIELFTVICWTTIIYFNII
jgi:hypothetical protein